MSGSRKIIFMLNLSFVILLAFSACIKKKDYPTTPVIAYKDFVNFGADSGFFTLKFTDGDGDFGLNPEDTTGNYGKNSAYYYNLYMKYLYKKADGTWSAYFNPNPMVNDTQYYKFRVPFILQTGKDKSQDGEVRVKLTELRPSSTHKAIKYVLYIYDKALHQSNVVTSPDFALP